MQTIKALAIGVIATVMLLAAPAQAKEDKSMGLFINLTMLATVPAGHALHMAEKQMERGHPVTFFLNNQAVLFASKRDAAWEIPHGRQDRSGDVNQRNGEGRDGYRLPDVRKDERTGSVRLHRRRDAG